MYLTNSGSEQFLCTLHVTIHPHTEVSLLKPLASLTETITAASAEAEWGKFTFISESDSLNKNYLKILQIIGLDTLKKKLNAEGFLSSGKFFWNDRPVSVNEHFALPLGSEWIDCTMAPSSSMSYRRALLKCHQCLFLNQIKKPRVHGTGLYFRLLFKSS